MHQSERWIATKIRELIQNGVLRVRLDGKVVGQVNGLAVANLGDYAFGRPSRVKASSTYVANTA